MAVQVPELRADRRAVMYAVMQDGRALRFASEGLRGDKKVVLEAVKNCSLPPGLPPAPPEDNPVKNQLGELEKTLEGLDGCTPDRSVRG